MFHADIRGIAAFIIPYANADQANHAPNENLRIDCFLNGIRTGAALLACLPDHNQTQRHARKDPT